MPKQPAHGELCRVSAALVGDLVASQAANERTLQRAIAEVEDDMQRASAAAWARAAAVQQRCASDEDLRLGMREAHEEAPTPALPALRRLEGERLCRRLLAAERRAAAIATQRDSIRELLVLTQRRCAELLAENAQVFGVNESLNGMLAILSADGSSPHEADEAERAAARDDDSDDPEALAGLMAAIYGPQYAMLRDGEQAVALAPEADSDDEIVE